MSDWRRALAYASLFGLVAPIYFLVFWRWFDFWRTRRPLWFAMLGGIGAVVYGLGYVMRHALWAGRIPFPVGVQAVGWALAAASTVLGTVADRQIGVRVRSFRPFFESHGRIKLVTTGAYGVVRHPIYASGLGCLVGFFLVTGYVTVMATTLIFGLGLLWFTRQEEQRLVRLLDDPSIYEEYRARVPALIPRLPRRTA